MSPQRLAVVEGGKCRVAVTVCGSRGCCHQVVSNFPHKLREFVDQYCAQYALLGLQFLWTADVESALDGMRNKKGITVMKELAAKTSGILATLSSWCLQDLGSAMNRYARCSMLRLLSYVALG